MSLAISRDYRQPVQMTLLNSPQQHIQRIEMVKGQRFQPELSADSEETVLVLKGKARLKIGGDQHTMAPNTLVKLTSNKIAKICNDQDEPLQLFWIKATVSLAERQAAANGVYIRRKEDCYEFIANELERIYELFGKQNGDAEMQSVAIVEIAPGGSSLRHYHPVVNETYLVTEGEGKLVIGSNESIVRAGDTVVIPVGINHQIFNVASHALKLVVVVTPPWTVDCGVYN